MAKKTDNDKFMLAACKSLFEQIQRTWGNGWKMLGDDLKRAVIAERVLYVFTARDPSTTITGQSIHDYLTAMNHYCGLDEEK